MSDSGRKSRESAGGRCRSKVSSEEPDLRLRKTQSLLSLVLVPTAITLSVLLLSRSHFFIFASSQLASKMASSLPSWPPALPSAQVEHLTGLALDYALSHGLIYRPPYPANSTTPLSASAISAPISLFPSPFPRDLHARALRVQELYNELYARVTLDEPWLEDVVKGCFWGEDGGDDFMRNLWKGWTEVRKQGVTQVRLLLTERRETRRRFRAS